METKKYPIGAEHYTLYEEVGQGVSASVHRALCNPLDEIVAIKILDFERDNCDLNNVSREAQTMILVDHTNVLKSHCSFVSDHNLWVVMPFMAGGSCLHILKAAYQDGFEEVIIATMLREVLKGLEYLHHHGHIHRDVKAGNILIDSRGKIKLGDFGVSASLFDSGDRQRMRNTFVGTPCWMAPEVMEQLHGYDFKADIWSFGITALELAHGHAPFSKYPPMKVLLMTLQNAPPGLDYERDKKFSKSFKQMIASCLVKDPSKRPSAKKLLKHSFFKQARSSDYIARALLEGLPALGDRLKALKRKEEDMLAQKKIPDGQKEEISQNEYKRGISGWNFDLDDVKAQASLLPDEDVSSDKDQVGNSNFGLSPLNEKLLQRQLSSTSSLPEAADIEDKNPMRHQSALLSAEAIFTGAKYEKSDDDISIASSTHDCQISRNTSPRTENQTDNNLAGKSDLEMNGRLLEGSLALSHLRKGGSSSCVNLPDILLASNGGESDKVKTLSRNSSSCNASTTSNDDLDEKLRCQVVQQKGRFKVTSESVDLDKDKAPLPLLQKSRSMQVIAQLPNNSPPLSCDVAPPNIGHSLMPMLHSILQTNIVQRDSILGLLKQVSLGDQFVPRGFDGGASTTVNINSTEKSMLEAAHDREKELINEITDLQLRLIRAQEELQKYKTENARV